MSVIYTSIKNGDGQDQNNYRRIPILSCFGTLFKSILNRILNSYLENYQSFDFEEQAGFRTNYSTIGHLLFSLKLLTDFFLNTGKNRMCFC